MGPLPAQAPTPPVTKKNKTNNDSGATTTAAKSNVNDNTTLSAQPTANPLAAYASYTYGLALHLLPPEQYRQLINNPGVAFKPTVTLVASAGRYNSTPPRDASFTDDFYFDNFKLSSVIGLNAVNRGSNAVNLQFSLIEPYGLSFLNRLLDTATRLNIPNYLDVPYLLEISFYGADDDGMYAKLSGQTKLIPIRILGIKIRAGSKGSEYQITAVPYGSLAHMQSLAATKANFSITSRTVGEFFKNMADDYGSVNAGVSKALNMASMANRVAQQQASNAANKKATVAKDYSIFTGTAAPDIAKQRQLESIYGGTPPPDTTHVTVGQADNANKSNTTAVASISGSSFADIWNIWQQQETFFGYQKQPDEISFVIHPDIAQAKIVEPKLASPAKAAGADSGGSASKDNLPTGSPKPTGSDFTKSFFNIGAGTSIMTVINNMIVNSEYIRQQLVDLGTEDALIDKSVAGGTAAVAKTAKRANVNWFKVTTKIELKDYDEKRGIYGKKITYYINPYTHYESSFPGAPISQPKGTVKDYQYIYTGHNTDIIEFNIEFNALWSQVLNFDRNKMALLNPAPTASGGLGETLSNGKIPDVQPNQITPTQRVYVSGSQATMTGGSDSDPKSQQAANFADNLYTSSSGDMLELKLKIMGDPQFIKQDEILFNSDKLPSQNGQFVNGPDSSLNMDSGEVYCRVSFKTPVDINEETGLTLNSSAWNDVYFSGLYRLMSVDSEFRQGQFIQTLLLIRHRNQTDDSKGSGNSAATSDSISNRAVNTTGTIDSAAEVTQLASRYPQLTKLQTATNDGTVGPTLQNAGPQQVVERYDFRTLQQDARLRAITQAKAQGLSDAEAEARGAIAGNDAGTAAFVTLSKNAATDGTPIVGPTK